jgi:hypothetical protein
LEECLAGEADYLGGKIFNGLQGFSGGR